MASAPPSSPRMRRIVALVVVAVVAVVAVVVARTRRQGAEQPVADAPGSARDVTTTPAPRASHARSAAQPRAAAAPRKLPSGTRVDRERAGATRGKLLGAHPEWALGAARRAEAPVEPAPPPAAARADAPLATTWITSRIREDLVPILVECYDAELERDPELAGKLVLSFRVVADPDIGSVVESARIEPGETTLTNAAMQECMVESALALEFDVPEGEGYVDVTYPFDFEPE